jgi:hypothetical protein
MPAVLSFVADLVPFLLFSKHHRFHSIPSAFESQLLSEIFFFFYVISRFLPFQDKPAKFWCQRTAVVQSFERPVARWNGLSLTCAAAVKTLLAHTQRPRSTRVVLFRHDPFRQPAELTVRVSCSYDRHHN